ncbi:Ig-like protein group 3 [Isoptericola variabilis J7]|nr:Ig-like protein group 3 [Isoptericola variabilis J7]
MPVAAAAPRPAPASGPVAATTTTTTTTTVTTDTSTTAAEQSAEQVLTWTANNSVTAYASAPATAVAGPATIVFDNSVTAGNTIGMSHTLTFDTTTPGYNHDVTLDILANPWDTNRGVHEAQVVLTPGTYRYFCAIPGHGTMAGELVVTDGGGQDDTTAPTVTAEVTGEQDADGAYVGAATVTLSAADDSSGVASIEYDLDDAGYTAYTAPVAVDTPGAHTLRYRATDNAGNVSEVGTVTFTVASPDPGDVTAPTVTAEVAGERDDDGAYVGSATVTLSATDDDSGVASIEYDLDGAGYVEYTGPIVIDEPGMHMVGYRATDEAGNTSEAGMVHLVVVEEPVEDTTPPTVSAEVAGEQDADGAYVGAATVTLAATDDRSGVASIEYDLDGAGFTAYTGAVVVDTPGAHTLAYRATDGAGNVSQAGSVSFTVVEPVEEDTTPPTVAAQVTGDMDGDGAYVGSATVVLTAEDAGSGVATVEYELDGGGFATYTGPVAVDAPGTHTVRFRAIDNAGNVSEPGSVTFTVVEPEPDDTTAPTVEAQVLGEQDAHGRYVGSATVVLSAADTGSGVATVEYEVDGAGFVEYTDPVVLDTPGTYAVRYRAVDNAGNVSVPASLGLTVVAADEEPADTTAPTVSAEVAGDLGDDGAYLGSATVTITAQDDGSGVASIEYALGDGPFQEYTGPVTVSAAGSHELRFRATDEAGNTSEVESVTFRVAHDGTDACPASDERPTVVVAGVVTTVPNVDTGNGCTINDLVDEDGAYANHGAFVAHVRELADRLVADGHIGPKDRPRLVSAAARSDVGR